MGGLAQNRESLEFLQGNCGDHPSYDPHLDRLWGVEGDVSQTWVYRPKYGQALTVMSSR
jgi:hypothetical protein